MTNTTKSIVALVGAVVICAAIYGAYQYPKFGQVAGSTAGTTLSNAKLAAVVVNLGSPGTTGTTSSILNTDAGTRYVTGARLGCDGIGTSKTAYDGSGLAAFQLSIGTSSTAGANTIGATTKVLSSATIPTTSAMYSFASSTSFLGTTGATIWRANEYMTFQFNATNTAACTVGVDYVQS